MEKYTEKRPWGKFEQFCLNQKCTVKILSVDANQELSLQYHHHREEFWRVVAGEGIIVIGEEDHKAKEGDEFVIPVETKHRIRTEGSSVKIMEISFGEFDENDIVRLEDKYKRV
ncbi:MAG: cupin domain-containing protein [bacterium]|nr:cupin domain-containing protein [bacterium]